MRTMLWWYVAWLIYKRPPPTCPAHQPILHCNSATRHKALLKLPAAAASSRAQVCSAAMASRSALIALLVVVSCAAAASATPYTVGDSSGWGFSVNYSTWASGKPFAVGDTLLFTFTTGSHDVVEVSKSGYDSCSISNNLNTIQNGPATVTLTTAGTHYYICGFTGHCGAGMKLAVDVGSGSGSGAPAPGGSPGSPAPGGSPGTPSPPSSASARLAAAPALAVAAGVLVKFALF